MEHLKNHKSCSFDSITNEMIKYSINIMANPLLKAFSHVLHPEKFPTEWSEGYILFHSGWHSLLNMNMLRGIVHSEGCGTLDLANPGN